ncbi:hypothetical protein KBB27_00075 [Patescibacteria group bacterium]|nr:hypothetical protein [Patescibacteria group bacterium]
MTDAMGKNVVDLVPHEKLEEFKKLVGAKRLGAAVKFLGGVLATLYGGNDVPREAILGATRGIAERLDSLPAEATSTDLEKAIGGVDALKDLKRIERAQFDPPKALNFSEAFASLSPERQELIGELCGRFPGGEYHSLTYSALQLVGVADELRARDAGAREADGTLKQSVVDGFKKMFMPPPPPPNPVKELGKKGEEAVDAIQKIMAKFEQKTGTPVADHLTDKRKKTARVTPLSVLKGK